MPYYPPPSAGGGANTALSNLASTAVNTTIASDTTLTDDLGTSSIYWNNAYAKALNLNSTASIDGSTAGILSVVGAVGIGTAAPTHTLTLPSTSTGIALYNTVDQTTNYERLRMYWNTNQFDILVDRGGTGTTRDFRIANNSGFIFRVGSGSSNGMFQMSGSTTFATGIGFNNTTTFTASSGLQYPQAINSTINQSGTAGYTALLINPTETATGSGAKNLIDAQVGSVSKFLVNNAGSLTLADAATIAVGTTTGTKIGTATSQKLGFFNATPVVQQTGDIITALSNLGLVTSGTVTGGITRTVSSISTPTTAGATASTDYVYLVSGTTTLTLPTAVGNTNRYTVKNVDASLTTTIATTSAQTIDGSASATLPVSNTSVDLISNGSNWAII